jgi:Putative lactococcus lactis phage r1t holin
VFTKKFLKDAAERAISTVAQTALALIIAVAATPNNGLTDVPWLAVVNVSALAGLISVLKSIVASRVNPPDSASLVDLDKS